MNMIAGIQERTFMLHLTVIVLLVATSFAGVVLSFAAPIAFVLVPCIALGSVPVVLYLEDHEEVDFGLASRKGRFRLAACAATAVVLVLIGAVAMARMF